jgi:hypothetical protein
MLVNWTANDGPQVVVGLGNSAVEYYNGSSWSQLHDDSWDSSVNSMQVNWTANDGPQVVVGLGSGAVEYYNGSSWSQLQGDGWGSAVNQATTQWNNNNPSWGLANFQVNQSNAYLEMLANGSWINNGNGIQLAGIAELANASLPNLPWANGGPALSTNSATLNAGFGLGLNSAGQFVSVPVNQASDSYNSYLVQAPPIWAPQAGANSGDVSETFNNYTYDWSSIPFNVRDGRQNLAFAITSASQAKLLSKKISPKDSKVHSAPRRTISSRRPVASPSQPQRFGATQRISMGMAISSPIRSGEKPR